ncbi:hypothetical protein FGO68_gene5931 [Halteria grandinella]|uniref:Uncharacterized protein n=1 Tax=Halteria grandinella TaxID=5974 RepID=A0A8J8NAJ1_HALGN|nr:hypothetical protein FGO68_gene5931 [Halteria grandinella]
MSEISRFSRHRLQFPSQSVEFAEIPAKSLVQCIRAVGRTTSPQPEQIRRSQRTQPHSIKSDCRADRRTNFRRV